MSDLYNLHPKQIVMYATEYCADCYQAKAFFEANNIKYLRVGLEGDEEAIDFVTKINKGNRSVPTIVFPNGAVLVEPSWGELRDIIQSTDLQK